MKTKLREVIVVVTAALAGLGLMVSTASAQEYPPPTAFDVTCVVDGSTVSCTIVGAEGGEQLAVTVTCDGTVVYNQTLTADADGAAAFSFQAAAGDRCDVSVLGAASGSVAAAVQVAADDDDAVGTPVAGAPSGRLPFTGGEVGALLAVGILLLAGGLFALRRREDAKVSA